MPIRVAANLVPLWTPAVAAIGAAAAKPVPVRTSVAMAAAPMSVGTLAAKPGVVAIRTPAVVAIGAVVSRPVQALVVVANRPAAVAAIGPAVVVRQPVEAMVVVSRPVEAMVVVANQPAAVVAIGPAVVVSRPAAMESRNNCLFCRHFSLISTGIRTTGGTGNTGKYKESGQGKQLCWRRRYGAFSMIANLFFLRHFPVSPVPPVVLFEWGSARTVVLSLCFRRRWGDAILASAAGGITEKADPGLGCGDRAAPA